MITSASRPVLREKTPMVPIKRPARMAVTMPNIFMSLALTRSSQVSPLVGCLPYCRCESSRSCCALHLFLSRDREIFGYLMNGAWFEVKRGGSFLRI
ncbi:MAG: hypothetical protein ACD_75C00907G0001 [uncultured bacterium]|nr:MAG: hypothetical protein ACD_75C00907G0001 [uncultured bacterium]